MNVAVSLVGMRREDRFCVLHAQRFQGAEGSVLHLLAGRIFARTPAERQMDAVLFAQLRPAALVEGVKLHDAPGQFGVVLGLNFETETRSPDPGNAAGAIGFQDRKAARFWITSLAEDVPNGTRHTAPDNAPGDHNSSTWAIAFLTASIAVRRTGRVGSSPTVLACLAN